MWHLSSAPVGLANPVNPAVVAGQATVSGVGTNLVTIQQASHSAIINWSQFNIAPNEVTSFLQPVGGVALNRIFDASPSLINGALNATGTVFLLNPNGVLFGANAQVNVGGLVASTLHMTDADFLAGIYRFGGPATHLGLGDTAPNGMVRNEGEITAGPFGVYLFAHNVENAGIIRSPSGHIALAAGSSAYLSNRPDGRGLFVEVTAPTGHATNLKDLVADGGQVSLFGKVVNQSGLIQANSVQQRNGRVELIATDAVTLADGSRILAYGDSAVVSDGGTVIAKAGMATGQTDFQKGALIDVSGGTRGGNGGFIELSASKVTWDGAFRAHALSGYQGGKLLIDPAFTDNPITTAALDRFAGSGLNDIEFQSPIGQDLLVTARYDLGENWVLPVGQIGTLRFNAGRDLLFSNASITNGDRGQGVSNTRWNYELFANQHIEVKGSVLSTGSGGSITMEAGRDPALFGDIRLVQSGSAGSQQPVVETFGGDITITTNRDLIAPSGVFGQSGSAVVSGIRLNESGNLTLNVGRDFLGGTAGNSKVGPGFLLANGIATVTVGTNVGPAAGQNPSGGNVGSPDAYANLTVGGGTFDLDGNLTGAFKQKVIVNAPGHIYWGVMQDRGLVEDLSGFGIQYITAHPDSSVTLTSSGGDIFLKPLLPSNPSGGLDVLRQYYPASFDARAPNGSIKIETNLVFWPSITGRLNFFAKNDISGVTKITGSHKDGSFQLVFVGDTLASGSWQLLEVAKAAKDPLLSRFLQRPDDQLPAGAINLKPSPNSFSASQWPEVTDFSAPPVIRIVQGDLNKIQGAVDGNTFTSKLNQPPQAVDPNHQPQEITLKTQMGDIYALKLDATSPVFKKIVSVEAGRDLGRITLPSGDKGGGFSAVISVPEGVTANVSAAGNMDLTKTCSTCVGGGLVFYGKGTAQVRVGSLDGSGNLNPGTGDLNLGDSQGILHQLPPGVPQSNGGGFVDIAVGKDLLMTQSRIISQNGAAIWIHGLGTRPALDPTGAGGSQVVTGTIEAGTNRLIVDGKVVKANGQVVVLDGTQPLIDTGTIVLDHPGALLNGKAFSPVVANGKPVLIGDRIVLLVDGQVQLAKASLVTIEQATGGNIVVGTLASRDTTGILTVRGGGIDIKAGDTVDVFKSRIATFGGGNVNVITERGDINAGSGGRNESLRFEIDITDADGNKTGSNIFFVPGSGIFTFHPNDPKFPLNFPKFDTPQIMALKAEIVKQNFLGRNTASLEHKLSALVTAREPVYRQIFEKFITENPAKPELDPVTKLPTGRFLPLELGDINLRAGRDLVVPSAGIRGRRISISAGRNLDLQGGTIEGDVQFDVGGKVQGSLSSFVGSFSGAAGVGGTVSGGASGGGSSLGGGLSGVTGTVAATASSTSSSSGTASKTVEAVQERATEASTQYARAAAQTQTAAAGQDGQKKAFQTVKVKRGVVIQVDVKPEVKPEVKPAG
jgi:filamentous hemagglutinin family protein